MFTGEVAGNLVHRDMISADGVTFSANRPNDGVEFLASTDVWFRPCNFANAPDGNLYMMDVYRMFIETPESIPEEIKKGMDFYAGDTMGRIFRITSNSPRNLLGKQRDLQPRLGSFSVENLVETLANTNGWHRTTAQRLIVERQDKSAIPLLKQLIERSVSPTATIHALWTLEGLSASDEQIVLKALKHPHPRVREHAIRIAEELTPKSRNIADALLAMTNDADLRVQHQLSFSLGAISGTDENPAMDALADLAVRHGENQWFRLAILSSVADRSSRFFHLLRSRNSSFENKELFGQLASMIGAKHELGELSKFLGALSALKQPESTLAGLSKGLKLANVSKLPIAIAEASLLPFLNSDDEATQKAAWETARFFELRALVQKAIADSQNAGLSSKQRAIAIRAMRGGQFPAVAPILQKFLPLQDSPELQIAAIESLSSFEDPNIAATLLSSWKNYTPEIRQKAIGALLSERNRMKALMKALENGQVERTMADPAMQARLYDHPDKEVAERARQFFKQEAGEREAAVAGYRDVLNLTGDVNRGRDLYGSTCAKCHSPQKGRQRIGADLSGINNKTKEELLNSILNPSEAIDARFVNYVLTMKDGRIFDGILANETPSAITLRNTEGDVTILRKNIAELRASSLSLMPDGMEKTLSKQQVADLIAYLRGGL